MTLPTEDQPEKKVADAGKPETSGATDATPNFRLVPDEGDVKAEASGPAATVASEASKTAGKTAGKPDGSEPTTEKAATSQSATHDIGKALAPAGASPINPFLAAAAAAEDKPGDAAVPPRSIGARLLDYSAHAAIIVGLIGFAWTVSDHVINRPAKSDPATTAAAAPAAPTKLDEMAELKLANQKMHDEIKALKASVDSLRYTARRDTTPEQVRMLSAGLDAVKGTLAASKSETNAQISQLSSKIAQLQPAKVQQLTERLGRLERQSTDATATGSIARAETASARAESARLDVEKPEAKAAPKPPVKPQALASAEDIRGAAADEKPQVIQGWVVRDVYQGVALIEGRYGGTREIVPGTSIPGAGVVKSIDRHGGGWTVTTTKGQIAYAGGMPQRDPRDYRRGPYGGRGYGPYGYGY